jgi:hypothetical protein
MNRPSKAGTLSANYVAPRAISANGNRLSSAAPNNSQFENHIKRCNIFRRFCLSNRSMPMFRTTAEQVESEQSPIQLGNELRWRAILFYYSADGEELSPRTSAECACA